MLQTCNNGRERHTIPPRRPRRPAHTVPLRRGFGHETLPTLPPQTPTSQPTTSNHKHSQLPNMLPRLQTTRPDGQLGHEPHRSFSDPRQPQKAACPQPPRPTSTSSKKSRRPASLSSSAPLCKLSFSSVLHRLVVRVESSPDRRPKLNDDALDAPPRSNILSAKNTGLLGHSARQVSAV